MPEEEKTKKRVSDLELAYRGTPMAVREDLLRIRFGCFLNHRRSLWRWSMKDKWGKVYYQI